MSVHRTFKALEPKCEIAVAQRPEGMIKVMIFNDEKTLFEFTIDRKDAFDLAMEMLQHAYRLGEGEKP